MLLVVKIDRWGRVTIPKRIRDRLGVLPGVELELKVVDGELVLARVSRAARFQRWKGSCAGALAGFGFNHGDELIAALRGRR